MDSPMRQRVSLLTQVELDRIERISNECHPTRKPVPMRIYPDDAAFLLLIIDRLTKALNDG